MQYAGQVTLHMLFGTQWLTQSSNRVTQPTMCNACQNIFFAFYHSCFALGAMVRFVEPNTVKSNSGNFCTF